MQDSFTAGALRALERAQIRARERGASAVEPTDLLAALADEVESRAAELLSEFGCDPVRLWRMLGASEVSPTAAALTSHAMPLPQSLKVRSALNDASIKARTVDRTQLIGTEHLLASLLAAPGPIADLLASAGLELAALLERATQATKAPSIPMAADIPPLELTAPGEGVDLGRILDASANRAARASASSKTTSGSRSTTRASPVGSRRSGTAWPRPSAASTLTCSSDRATHPAMSARTS